MKETSAADNHFFVGIHGRGETIRLWGDGPRSTTGGLTPEVGIAIRSQALREGPLLQAIGRLLQSSLRWQNVPISQISPILKTLVAEQARIYDQWAAKRQTA